MLPDLDLDVSVHLLNFTTSCFAVYVWSQKAWSASVVVIVVLFEQVSLTVWGTKHSIVFVALNLIDYNIIQISYIHNVTTLKILLCLVDNQYLMICLQLLF